MYQNFDKFKRFLILRGQISGKKLEKVDAKSGKTRKKSDKNQGKVREFWQKFGRPPAFFD